MDLGPEDFEVYKLSESQQQNVREAQEQIKKGQFLTDQQTNDEIDQWLEN